MSTSRVRETVKICAVIAVTAIVVGLAIPVAATAAGQLVTIVGPDNQQAGVQNGKLKVVGTAGREVEYANFYHSSTSFVEPGSCVTMPLPANSAMIVKSLRLNFLGSTGYASVYKGTCVALTQHVGYVDIAGKGLEVIEFEPGLALAANTGIAVFNNTDHAIYLNYVGYTLGAGAISAASEPAPEEPPAHP